MIFNSIFHIGTHKKDEDIQSDIVGDDTKDVEMRVRIHVDRGYPGSDTAHKPIYHKQQNDKNVDKNKMWPASYSNSGFEIFSATPFATVGNIKDIVHENMGRRYSGRK